MLKKFFDRLRPVDIIAVICIIFGFYLLLKGVDHVVGAVVLAISAYYFGHARSYDDTKIDSSGPGDGGV